MGRPRRRRMHTAALDAPRYLGQQVLAQPQSSVLEQQLVPQQQQPYHPQQQLQLFPLDPPQQPSRNSQFALTNVPGSDGHTSPFTGAPPVTSELARRVGAATEQMERVLVELNESSMMFDELNARMADHVNEEQRELQQRNEQLTTLEQRLSVLLK